MKRLFDIVISGLLLICLLPVIFIIVIAVGYNLGSPIFLSRHGPEKMVSLSQ